MSNPTEFLYILAGNHQQYEVYIRDSEISWKQTKYVDSTWSIAGVRFNKISIWQPEPKGIFRKLLHLSPKFVEVVPERINRLIVFGTWRRRKDINDIRVMAKMNGAQLPE